MHERRSNVKGFDRHSRLGWSKSGEVDKQMEVSARTRGEVNLSRTPRRASPTRLKRFQEIVEEMTRQKHKSDFSAASSHLKGGSFTPKNGGILESFSVTRQKFHDFLESF